jgi:hypothetical protein
MTQTNEHSTSPSATRVDLHCHSTASAVSKLGIQRSVGLPECATPPEEVYELAKRRGMDFVTITDHDTIDGALELAARHDDVFVSEELTAWFKGEQQAVHVLVYGITPDDHAWLQAHNDDVEACAEYLHENEITTALAHPFYAVEAPLTPRHRRRLAELFPSGRSATARGRASSTRRPRSTSRRTAAPASPGPTTTRGRHRPHVDADAARRDGRRVPREHPRRPAEACGEQGSAAKWAHAAMAIAIRALGASDAGAKPNPVAVMKMVERTMTEGNLRRGDDGADLCPEEPARCCGRGWTPSTSTSPPASCSPGCRPTTSRTPTSSAARGASTSASSARRSTRSSRSPRAATIPGLAALTFFDAALAAVPYAPGRRLPRPREGQAQPRRAPGPRDPARRARRRRRRRDARRDAHDRGDPGARVPGYEIEVIGTTRPSTAGCPPCARSTSRSTPACRSACPACRRSSRRSPRAATTSCTCARPARAASPPRCWAG